MNVVILEDEPPALAGLTRALARVAPDARVVASAASVREAVALLRHAAPAPDLVLADVQLADGPSLAVFDEVAVRCPVVFVTAHDEHVMAALRAGGIDYLLKPVADARLAEAIDKVRRLEGHFVGRAGGAPGAFRRRILVKRGIDWVSIPIAEVAYFKAEHKVVVLVPRTGASLLVDQTLGELEAQLDPAEFFRVNRAYLAHHEAVTRFRAYLKGRLLVDLAPPASEDVVVSQENAARFKAWLDR